jgi:septal ring factor EnvC (AmiA/AmiB activator)
MSEEIKNALREVLQEALKPIVERLDRIEKKLDSTHEQVVRNSESQTETKQELNTHEHHFNVIDKQLVKHAIEIEKLKNR